MNEKSSREYFCKFFFSSIAHRIWCNCKSDETRVGTIKCDMGMRVDGAGRVREKTQIKYNTHIVIQLSFILLMNGFLEWIHFVVRKEFLFT